MGAVKQELSIYRRGGEDRMGVLRRNAGLLKYEGGAGGVGRHKNKITKQTPLSSQRRSDRLGMCT